MDKSVRSTQHYCEICKTGVLLAKSFPKTENSYDIHFLRISALMRHNDLMQS